MKADKTESEFEPTIRSAILSAYDLLTYWKQQKYAVEGSTPGYVFADLDDVPAVISKKAHGRMVVTVCGFDLWDSGSFIKPNASQDEAIEFLEGNSF